MSDLFKARKKTEEGTDWRGTINVTMDDEQMELTVRQMNDTEYWDVMSLIDTDELRELQDSLPEEKMEQFQELRDKDDLDEDEEAKLETLQDELENSEVSMFDALSKDTFLGIKQAAKYGWEPDENDCREALIEHGGEIEEQYGKATTDEARKYLNKNVVHPTVENAQNFSSFAIGIKVLTETVGDRKNSKN